MLATNRHISCGAQELENLSWSGNVLSGISKIPVNDLYILYLHEPPGFNYQSFKCKGATFVETYKNGNVREIKLRSTAETMVEWKVLYCRR